MVPEMNRKKYYRDMDRYRETRNAQKRRYYGRTQKSMNSGQSWTPYEIKRVMEHDVTDMQLSKEIGRSVAAIQCMRTKLKREEAK